VTYPCLIISLSNKCNAFNAEKAILLAALYAVTAKQEHICRGSEFGNCVITLIGNASSIYS
jgi:hypothetical protein